MTIAAIVILSAIFGGMSGAFVAIWTMEHMRKNDRKDEKVI